MKISIVMPAYNCSKYIEAAVRSALRQTWTDFELIVIDDCSEDATPEIAARLAAEDDRILLLRNERNSGVSASRNTGTARARGEWIAFLDSDDLWREDKLEKQAALIQKHPDAVLCYTASAFMDECGHKSTYILEAEDRTTYQGLLRRNLLSCSSVMVRRDMMLRHPMGGDRMHEDYAAWLLILREAQYAYGLNEPLLTYRISRLSKSSGRLRSARMLLASYRYVGYSLFTSAVLTFRYMFHSISKRRKIMRSMSERRCRS